MEDTPTLKEELIAFEPISRVNARLHWVQLASNEFELRGAGHRLGRLKFHGSSATGITADGKWDFDFVGFLRRRIRIRETETLRDVGSVAVGGSQAGIVVGPQGTERLSKLIWSQRQRAWATADDWLVRFHPGGESSEDLFKFQFDVEIEDSARNYRELSLLILIGWYALARRRGK